MLSEIEMCLNNRPLTYTYSEQTEEVVSPNHLTFGCRLNTSVLLYSKKCEIDNNDADIPNRQQYVATLIDHVWKRWKYLSKLRERHRWLKPIKSGKEIVNIGDVWNTNTFQQLFHRVKTSVDNVSVS